MPRVPALAVLAAALGAWLLAGTGESGQSARLVGAAAAAATGMLLVRHIRTRLARGRAGAPDAFEVVWRGGAEQAPLPEPPERQRLQRLLRLAVSDADHAHRRLRPLLRDLADARFEAAHGVHLDRDERAAERLDQNAWAWLRPDRPQPADRHGRGPALEEVAAVIATIERIGGDGETGRPVRVEPVERRPRERGA